MNQYLEKATSILGVDRNVNRLAQVTGSTDAPWASVFNKQAPSMDIPDGIGTVAGIAVGAFYGHKKGGHWLLGAIAGGSLGRNLPALVMHPEQRNAATRNLLVTGVAVMGSMYMQHNKALGFALGYVGAALATYYGGLK